MARRRKPRNTGFVRPAPDEHVCFNCKHMAWMVGIGQGVRCKSEKRAKDVGRRMPVIPKPDFACEHFEFSEKKPPRIILAAVDDGLESAWSHHCGDLDIVRIHRGSILEVDCDAVVSPANSFGFMDGGIDALYTRALGKRLQKNLQRLIAERHHGELLVGTAEIVKTGNRNIPYLIAAPTMRVPMILKDTVNPYLAARAALLLVMYGVFPAATLSGKPVCQDVKTIAFPGMGTGVGKVPPDMCARQMRAAIEHVCLSGREFPESWVDAQRRHQELYTDDIRDLQL